MATAEFNSQLIKLSSEDDQSNILSSITQLLAEGVDQEELKQAVQASNLVSSLSVFLVCNKPTTKLIPDWAKKLICVVYTDMLLEIPFDQTRHLISALIEYYTQQKSGTVVELLARIVNVDNNKLPMLDDNSIYTLIKAAITDSDKNISDYGLMFVVSATDNCDEWQLKLLKDTSLILDVLSLGNGYAWSVLANVSHHPDAKILLPQKVLEKATDKKTEECLDICAVLCSESNIKSLTLPEDYVEKKHESLKALLSIQNSVGKFFRYSLLDLVLPLVNLSMVDANKETIGSKVIKHLMQIVTLPDDKPMITNIAACLNRAKEEAAKTLWELAFTEENRQRIRNDEGISKLTAILASSDEKKSKLHKNVAGVLYMMHLHKPQPSNKVKGHIMISYNWSQQPTILKLAQALKEHGYKIWLDVEHMNGSTLEAMADAIERAELVLVCMSQKYKDSPNCRLEGEYCVNTKVPYIPLMMQHNYKPDGWLGLTLGSKLYYSFADDEDWDSKITTLIKGIGNVAKKKVDDMRGHVPIPPSPAKAVKGVKDWTIEDIRVWMKEEGIEKHYEVFVDHHKFDGRAFVELKSLLSAPHNSLKSYLEFFKEGFKITKIGDMLRIVSAVRKL